MADINEEFDYATVPKRGLRAFKVIIPIPDNVEILSIQLDSFQSYKQVEYEAISYACGDIHDKVPISCNGKRLMIYRTLYEAVSGTYRQSKTTYLWADCICIDQADPADIAYFVSDMGPIYWAAKVVRVWLGPSSDDIDTFFDQIGQLIDAFAKPMRYVVIHDEALRSVGLPTKESPVYSAMSKVFSRSWFRRLWVIQEIVVASHVSVHCGNRMTTWTELASVAKGIISHTLGDVIPTPHMSTREEIGKSNDYRGWILMRDIDIIKATWPTKVANVIAFGLLFSHKCYEPLDKIYAWRWLVEPEIRNEITVDYSDHMKRNYHHAYMKFTLAALSRGFEHQILQLTCTKERLETFPSWCPNLLSKPESYTFKLKWPEGGLQSCPLGSSFIAVSLDRRSVLFRGKHIDVIEQVAVKYPDVEDYPSWVDRAKFLLPWMRSIMPFFGDPPNNDLDFERFLRTIVHNDFSISGNSGKASYEDLVRHFAYLVRMLVSLASSESSTISPVDGLSLLDNRRFLNLMRKANCGRRIFKSRSGRFGSGNHRIQPGDNVCIIGPGSPDLLFVLRPINEGTTFENFGSAYLEGQKELVKYPIPDEELTTFEIL